METHANSALARKNIVVDVNAKTIPHCYGYGCVKQGEVYLSKNDWNVIKKAMHPLAQNAKQERSNIKKAIARFEDIFGKKTGTYTDKAGTFVNMFEKDNQHDCVDESLNTTIYLTLLEQKGLLKFHTVNGPTVRLPLIHSGRWPHQTAVIKENDNGQHYAVDSWFHDNGQAPEIISLPEWKNGWKPAPKDKIE